MNYMNLGTRQIFRPDQVGYVTPDSGHPQGENEGEKVTEASGQPRTEFINQAAGGNPPSLLKPLVYATAVVAAISLLT